MKIRFRTDLEGFARHCFPEACRLPFNPLHRHLIARRLARTAQPLDRRAGGLDVVLAPRGAAKSTLVSLVFPLHALLYGHDRYILLIAATLAQARQRIANLRGVLEQPGPLRAMYAPRRRAARGAWVRRATCRTIELEGGRIEAFSAGTELRGISHGPWRPTWIILDDVERGDRVRHARHRDALADWFLEVVDNLGAGYTNIDLIGTLLHPDALPARLARRPDATARSFPSILAEAAADDLWAGWRALFHDLADPQRVRRARRFFEARQGAMLEGARVLWPEKEDYYALQVMRETRGRAAFDKEKQNAPEQAEAGVFRRGRLRGFRLEAGRLQAADGGEGATLEELRCFGFLDPALGGAGGDYAAIATVGVDPRGYCYVLDVWLARAAPSVQIARLFDLHARWGYAAFGLETNAFQRLLLDPLEAERQRRRQAGARWDVPIAERRHRGAKEDRILALEPLVAGGRLLFNEALDALFWGQMEDFPTGRHDDGPDAVAAAVELARRTPAVDAQPERLERRMAGRMAQY